MKIFLKRLGGFTGIPVIISIDTDQLDPQTKKILEEMVASTQFFSLPPKIQSANPGADRFVYRITVEALDASHTVEVSEASMPEGLQSLIQRVTLIGRLKPK